MVTIQKDTAILTLVNVFHVKPERQQAVADVLIEAGKTMSQLPGFISANIHTSHDGNRVVNYAQWRSREDYEAMLNNPKAQPHMAEAAGLAESYDPILCNVVDSREAAQAQST